MIRHPRRLRPAWLLPLLLAAVLPCSCDKLAARKKETFATLERLGTTSQPGPATEYRLDSQPFSPTLPYLFDQARLAVLPRESTAPPPPNLPADPYAFSAVDRFGRVYHFDIRGRWWMDKGDTLPEPLPPGQWDAAWNPKSGALELLVTAPWDGVQTVQLLRWSENHWSVADLAQAPPARGGAARLFQAAENRWLIAGGQAAVALGDGWATAITPENAKWVAWGAADSAKSSAPNLEQARTLIDTPAGSGPILLTRAGDLWIRQANAWKAAGNVKVENLSLALFDSTRQQILFIWGRGRGQDQFLWQSLQQIENGSTSMPEIMTQTAQVRVNDRDEGLWKGWGRAHDEKDKIGQILHKLTPGFGGTGEPAIQLGALDREKIIRRTEIELLELPPTLDSLRFEAAATVPACGGIVVPSACGLGIETRREPFFPPAAWDAGTTSATQHMIDIMEPTHRLWVFKEKGLDWIRPPYEIHPAIDYPNSYETIDGRRRCLAWTSPAPGLLRYEFREIHDKKVQWINSPPLTLRTIPQLAYTEQDSITLCDPVIWGDPPELIAIGWCGRLGRRVTLDKTTPGLTGEAYSEVPDRGFMVRTSALEPSQWKVSALPIPFCQGAQLVAAPDRGSLYLLGGKVFTLQQYNKDKLYVSHAQNDVWHWDGENWNRIIPGEGTQPRMKATSQAVYDPSSRQLLTLTPRVLYGFEGDVWHCLWQCPKERGDWPGEVALYVHPQSRTVLGAWFLRGVTLRVWKGTGWIPVQPIADAATSATARQPGPGGPLPNIGDNLLPATQPDCFISLDADALNALRMDAPRDRSRDRLRGAWWLTLKAANTGSIAYARHPMVRETSASAPVVAGAESTSTTLDVAATPTSGTRVLESGVVKTVKKNQTGVMMRRLESLTGQ